MKTQRLVLLLAFCSMLPLATIYAQAPEKVYGPVGHGPADGIRRLPSGQFIYFTFLGQLANFGDMANDWVYGLQQWSFDANTLPPGSTITKVQLNGKLFRSGIYYSTHASFSLYDVKIAFAPDDPSVFNPPLHNDANKLMDITTTTLDDPNEPAPKYETFDTGVLTSGTLLNAVQDALNSGRNFLMLGYKRIPEQGNGGEQWDLYTKQNVPTVKLTVWFRAPQYNLILKTDLGGASFGQLSYQINGGQQQPADPLVPVSLYWGDNLTLSANTGKYQYPPENPQSWKFRYWNDNPNDVINPKITTIHNASSYTARFNRVFDFTVQNLMDGQSWGTLTSDGGTVNSGYSSLDEWENTSHEITSPSSFTSGGRTWNFYGWQDGETNTLRRVILNSSIPYQAKFKAPMSTSDTTFTDAHNQRRVAYGSTVSEYYMLYESMGDIWLAYSPDNGTTWLPERRMSVRLGQASNPTISNVFLQGGTTPMVVMAWLEKNGSTTELHLQSMFFASNWWGWNISDGTRSSNNHRLITDLGMFPAPSSTARPVLQLDASGSNKLLTVAYERAAGGIAAAVFTITSDLGSIGSTMPRTISTHTSDCYPVIISYGAAYGYGARKYVYFLAGGYASGLRLAQFDYNGSYTTSLIAGGASDYTYYSLQGAADATGANFALVTEGWDYYHYFVNRYIKETYLGNSSPHLTISYTDMRKPTISLQSTGAFGSANYELDMKSVTDGQWYKVGPVPLTAIGSSIGGILRRDQVGANDWASVLCRDDVTPARLAYYSGSGPLPKMGSSPIAIDQKVVKLWEDSSTAGSNTMMLDFSGADVVVLDDTISEPNVVAVKILSSAEGGGIVRQVDSLALPVGVDLIQYDRSVQSYTPSAWNLLSTGSIPSFAAGDVIRFTYQTREKPVVSYTVVSLRDAEKLTKAGPSGSIDGDALSLRAEELLVYPNPFNPSTQLSFALGSSSQIKLAVYDVLGRLVTTLADGRFEAGTHSVSWNSRSSVGATLASGLYLARLQVSDAHGRNVYTKTTKLLLTK